MQILDGYSSNEDDGVYYHTRSRIISAEVNRSISPLHHELKDGEDDTDWHFTYASSETSLKEVFLLMPQKTM